MERKQEIKQRKDEGSGYRGATEPLEAIIDINK